MFVRSSVTSISRLVLQKNVCSFVIKHNKSTWSRSTQLHVSQRHLYFTKFYSAESSGANNGYSERTNDECQKIRTDMCALKLQEIYLCTREEAQAILESTVLTNYNKNYLLTNIKHVKLQGISLNTLQENPWVLTLSPNCLDTQLSIVRTLDFENINDVAPLIKLTGRQLMFICSQWKNKDNCFPDRNRIKYISEKLECPASFVCQLMVKYSFLRMMPAFKLKKNLDLMLSAGVSCSNILKDIWSVRTRCEYVEERLHRANEVGLPVLKPWLVRCQEQVFERTLERHTEAQALLGSKSLYEFLADKLNCNVQTAKIMAQRYPNIVHVNIPKINEVLEYLQENGFSMEQIQQVPRILCHSLETTRARFTQLHMLGFKPASLMVLCHSQHKYQKLVHKLELRKMRMAS